MTELLPHQIKHKGLKHLFLAGTYSWAGVRRMVQEPAFRQEIAYFCVILIVLWLGSAAMGSYLIAAILFAVLAAVETLNTAIEEIVNELSPQYSEFAKTTKDLGSFAVFTMLAANGLHALYAVLI